MEVVHVYTTIPNSERETVLNYDYAKKKWYMYTTVMKHYNKAKAKNWELTTEYRYEDETVCGGSSEAPSRAITIRDAFPVVRNNENDENGEEENFEEN